MESTKNWPISLDLCEWIKFSLSDEDEVSRRLALEELNAVGFTKDFLPLVGKIVADDPSQECRDLALNLQYLEGKKGEMEELSGHFETTPQSFRELLENSPPEFRKALLRVDWKIPPAALLDIWRDRLFSEEIPEIIAIGLSLLARAGNQNDSGPAISFLGAEAPEVVIAAIDLLFHQDRSLLKTNLAAALGHSNPDIRFHAIRRLAAIDIREAFKYLNDAIEGDDALLRRRSIQELSLLPIHETEPSFIRVIGLESRPLLLVIAGNALASNPKVDLPPHIYDTLMMSKGIKKHILDLTLRQVVNSVKAAGILTQSTEEYLESLKKELQSRRADLVLALTLRDLRSPEIDIRKQALEKLIPLSTEPKVQKAFRTRAKIEPNEELKSKFLDLIEDQQPEAKPPATQETATNDLSEEIKSETFFQKPVKQQISFLSSISKQEDFSRFKESLFPILEKSTERRVLVKTLKLFESFGSKDDTESIFPLLKSKDPSIIGSALRALSKLDFEKISIAINPLLRDDNLGIKAAALEIYIDCDKEGAWQYLKSMLLSPVSAIRRKALTIAPLMDFASIESILLEILNKDSHPDIQAQAGLLLASNPTEAGLKALYRRTHPEKLQPSPEAVELWDTARPAAARFFSLAIEEIDKSLETRIAEEDALAATDEPNYAFDKVARQKTADEESLLNSVDFKGIVYDRQNLAVIGIFAVFFFVFTFMENPPWGESKIYRNEGPPPILSQPRKEPATPLKPKNKIGGWKVLPGKWSGYKTNDATDNGAKPSEKND